MNPPGEPRPGTALHVLELSDRDDAAAYAGKLFARWGAAVTRVSAPRMQQSDETGAATRERARELYLHGGKHRLALDWHDPAQRPQLDALAAASDIVLTDAAPREVDRLHLLTLGASASAAGGRPPVRVSITPFGLSGPYRDFEATTATLLALGGYTWLMGDPGRTPLTMPGSYAWYQAGTFAYIGALAAVLDALEHAPATIDVSVMESLTSLHQFTDTMWTFNDILRSRHGNRWENLCPTTLLPTVDGWYGVNILPNFWFQFAHMIGHPEYTEPDHPFATNEGRMAHQDEVEAAVTEALRDQGKVRVFREGQETWRVPVGYAATLGDLFDDPHLSERGFWRPLDDVRGPGGGVLLTPGSPFRFVGEAVPEETSPLPLSTFVERGGEGGAVAGGSNPTAPPRSTHVEGGGSGAPRPVAGRAEAVDVGNGGSPTPPPLSTHVERGRGEVSPLAGLRVVDLTRIWSGPVATRILGDLGAEVIKVEANTGRGVPTKPDEIAGGRPWNVQGLFNKLNRNKQSVCVDLKRDAGRDLFLRLVAASDVVIENFSARAMPGLGLGYDALRAANPRVIYVAMPAFGLAGPYRDYVGLGPSIEPTTGLTALMGYSDDEPRVTAKAVTDPSAGTVAAAAILTALERRRRTGEGAFVELSQHEAGVAVLGEHFIERQLTGREPSRLGNAHPEYAPHGIYRCAGDAPLPGVPAGDNWLALAARSDNEWRALCAVAGQGWERDPRFADAAARRAHRAELDAAIEAWTSTRDKRELMERLQGVGVPAGAVLSAPEWMADPHLAARGYFVELDHPEAGRNRWDGSPLCFDGERGYEAWQPAPLLGEDNADVATRLLGYSSDEVARLVADEVLADSPPQ